MTKKLFFLFSLFSFLFALLACGNPYFLRLVSGNEENNGPDPNGPYMPRLDSPTLHIFNDRGLITFAIQDTNIPTNATYTFTLYRNDAPVLGFIDIPIVLLGGVIANLPEEMLSAPGRYTVRVTAHAPGFTSSEPSPHSPAVYVHSVSLNISGMDTAGASSESVVFYANNIEIESFTDNTGNNPFRRNLFRYTTVTITATPGTDRTVQWESTPLLLAGTTENNTFRIQPLSDDFTITATFAADGTNRTTLTVGPPSGSHDYPTLDDALNAILNNHVNNAQNFRVRIYEDQEFGVTKPLNGANPVSIALEGYAGGPVTLKRNTGANPGYIFSVNHDVTLILGSNIILQGRTGNAGSSLVIVNGGTLEMLTGSAIQGNRTDSNGGAVTVQNGGIFNMRGGTISGNEAGGFGGGVFVAQNSEFNMINGTISGNEADFGGAVYVENGGLFDMRGGTISGNRANDRGGGVFLQWGDFLKTGGTIYGNDAAVANNRNTAAANTHGHAVFRLPSSYRDSTVGSSDNYPSLNFWGQ